MSLYLGTTEITKLRDLAPQSGLDITDLWFGSTNIYTVWQTYEGTLPATLNANGGNMRQYQIYGNTGGVGEPTENILDESTLVKGFYTVLGDKIIIFPDSSSSTVYRSFRQSFAPGTYTISFGNSVFLARVIVDGAMSENVGENISSYTVTTQTGDIGFSMRRTTSSQTPWNNNPTMLTPGSTPPASFIPFGYEVDMGVKSSNVMPSAPAETKTSNGIAITCDGEGRYSISGRATAKASIQFDIPEFTLPVSRKQGGQGTMSLFNTAITPSSDNKIGFYYNSELIDEWSLNVSNRVHDSYVKMGDKKCNAIIIDIVTLGNVSGILLPMFTDNGEFPATYEPYSNTTTPIYIGDEPLDKDEYIDYQAGKIYRMIDGALTPTDPPVPLPALPTCEGETVIDYAGESVAPEKALLKYRKEEI